MATATSRGIRPSLRARWILLPLIAGLFTSRASGQMQLEWEREYDGLGVSDDEFVEMKLDSAGNLIVTGVSTNQATGKDLSLIKYNSDGEELWRARYTSADNWANESPVTLALGPNNSIVVAGVSDASALIVSYDADGELKWSQIEEGSQFLRVEPLGLAVDSQGNSCMTGRVRDLGLEPSPYFALWNYDEEGLCRWRLRENDGSLFPLEPEGPIIDSRGGIYVTGMTQAEDRSSRLTTIKFDRDGRLSWRRNHGEEGSLSNRIAAVIATDAAENIYVARTWGRDSAVVVYDPSGEELRVHLIETPESFFDTPTAMQIDTRGNIFLASHFRLGDLADAWVGKLDSAGNSLWERRFRGNWRFSNAPESLAVDAQGRCFVVVQSGGHAALFHIDPSGVEAESLALDSDFDRFAAVLSSGPDEFIIAWTGGRTIHSSKRDADDGELWTSRFDGPAITRDIPIDFSVDGSGSIYVTGTSRSQERVSSYATVKYDSSGREMWSVNFEDVSGGREQVEARAIAVDPAGNSHVTGTAGTIKYDSGGKVLWTARWSTRNAAASAIAVDFSGKVYLASAPGGQVRTTKLDVDGEELWSELWTPGNTTACYDIDVNERGDVAVVGSSTLLYDSTGGLLWFRGRGLGHRVELDSESNVHVIAREDGDFLTVKYSREGDVLWEQRYAGHGSDWPRDLVLGPRGEVYVTGGATPLEDSFTSAFTTMKYDSDGNEEWFRRYMHPGTSSGIALALAIDREERLYVSGYFRKSSSRRAGILGILEYDASGRLLGVTEYGETRIGLDPPEQIVISDSGVVYIMAESRSENRGGNYLTLAFSQPEPIEFLRGDVDASGTVELTDALIVLRYLFLSAAAPDCRDASDSDDNGRLQISDPIRILSYLFLGGLGPEEPGPFRCGTDPTGDSLDCQSFANCQ